MSEVAVSSERRLSQQCILRLPSHPQSCHPPWIINITNLQGRTWPANPHCNYIKYHTHSTNSDQSPELHGRAVIARREEKRRGEKEKIPHSGFLESRFFFWLALLVCLSLFCSYRATMSEFSLPYLLCQFDSFSVWNVCPV